MIRNQLKQSNAGSLRYKINNVRYKAKFNLTTNTDQKHFKITSKQYEGFNFTRIQLWLTAYEDTVIETCSINSILNLAQFENVFCKGYQSWSETGLYEPTEQFKSLNFLAKPIMGQMGDYTLINKKYQKGLRSWNYSYLNFQNNNDAVYFLGSCSEQSCFTLFHFKWPNQLNCVKDISNFHLPAKKQFLLFDLFLFEGNKQEAFDTYFDFLNVDKKATAKKAGYTSWYYHFNKISASYLNKQLNSFKKHNINFNYFQIDDGWQNTVGDWLHLNKNFGGEMCCLAKNITNAGYEPGIWLAPFICTRQSFIYKQKKDWLLKDKNNQLVKSGYNPLWGGFHYALNFYNEEVKQYLKQVFDTVFKLWKFKLVKLDFLYAVGLAPPPNKTRAQVFYDAMHWLQQVCGNNEILACGVPLLPALTTTKYCRIGPDADFAWRHWLRHVNHRERLSTLNALQNSITLNHLNGYGFVNDTDVCILRKNKNNLTFQEKITQLYTNYIFGDLFFISDEIDEYDEELMAVYKSCFPLKTVTSIKTKALKTKVFKSTFNIGKSNYTMFVNLSDAPFSINLNIKEKAYYDCISKALLTQNEINIQPHQTICVLNLNSFDIKNIKNIKDKQHILPETP